MSSAMKKVLELLWSGSVQSRRFNVFIKNLALTLFNLVRLYYLSWLILKIWWKVSFYNGNNSYSYVVYIMSFIHTLMRYLESPQAAMRLDKHIINA